MAIVNCSACGKRYSSINEFCPHCGVNPAPAARRTPGAGVGASVIYLAAILVAVIGAGWYYTAIASGRDPQYARWTVGVGITWYIGARIWAMASRRR